MRSTRLLVAGLLLAGCSESALEPEDSQPVIELLPRAGAPAIPATLDVKLTCLVTPDTTEMSTTCPVIQWAGHTYWVFSDGENASSMTVVAYTRAGMAARTWERTGARYIWQITVDQTARTVTLRGQSSRTIVLSWDELRI